MLGWKGQNWHKKESNLADIIMNDWYWFGHSCGIVHLTNSSVIEMDNNYREIKGHSIKVSFSSLRNELSRAIIILKVISITQIALFRECVVR